MSRARDNANFTVLDTRMPNLTGDVTTVEGAVATSITADAVGTDELANDVVITTSGLITANGGLETDTNSKIKQKGAFMQSSTHQALILGY